MSIPLHVISGEGAGGLLSEAGLEGEILIWRDVLYEGLRRPGWPDEAGLEARAGFLAGMAEGGLSRERVREMLRAQYAKLAGAGESSRLVLWFDACLFDQAMLAHVLSCLDERRNRAADLIVIDAFPGVVAYDGLGQLSPAQLASSFPSRRPVTDGQFAFSRTVDRAFADQDIAALARLARLTDAPLPWMPAAAARWLEERPDPETGMGRLERLAIEAIRCGARSPAEVERFVAAADGHPRFWGDSTLWGKINGLADRTPPFVVIEGPAPRLPRWPGGVDLGLFRIRSVS